LKEIWISGETFRGLDCLEQAEIASWTLSFLRRRRMIDKDVLETFKAKAMKARDENFWSVKL